MKNTVLCLVIVVALGACGFHLRGTQQQVEASDAKVYIVSEKANLVTAEVREQLSLSGNPAVDEAAAQYRLTLFGENIEQVVLSVSATTGKVEQYQVNLDVIMSVTSTSGTDLLTGEAVQLNRDYTFDEDAVLGKAAEEKLIREELVTEAAQEIIRRLNAVIRSSK